MTDLQIFKNPEFGEIRTIEKDGEPWFVGKDVAAALGYERPTKAILDHVDDEDKDEVPIQDSIGRSQNTPIINESGLYSLVLSSKLPGAKQFKRWITSEVIPSIRKHGGYLTPDKLEEVLLMLVLVEKMGVEEHPTMEICMHKVEQAHALMALEEMEVPVEVGEKEEATHIILVELREGVEVMEEMERT